MKYLCNFCCQEVRVVDFNGEIISMSHWVNDEYCPGCYQEVKKIPGITSQPWISVDDMLTIYNQAGPDVVMCD